MVSFDVFPENPMTPETLLGRQLNDVEQRFAPRQLYAQGDLSLLANGIRVSVVGTRTPSDLGRKRAAKLCRFLVVEGFTVVSGLARGLDTVAHEETLRAGGRTVAVLGNSLDRSYPPENAGLQRRIGSEHLLLSQYPPGTPPLRKNFPLRNRTMALISDATVVVEAGPRSGTQSQGWEALRLGRPLFLLRSLVEAEGLEWPRAMVDYGAFVLQEPQDILEELPSPRLESTASVAF